MKQLVIFLLFCLVLGWVLCGLLVIASLGPEPGAGMLLMGLPLLGLLMIPAGLALMISAQRAERELPRPMYNAALWGGFCSLLVFAALFLLG